MRQLLAWLLVVLAGALIVLAFYGDNGYVLIRFREDIIETSLAYFLFLMVLFLLLLVLAWRFLNATVMLPRRIREGMRQSRNRRARESLVRGLIRMAEGKWAGAESEIVRRAPQHDASVVNYLYAARVAQKLGAIERRDQHLRSAYGAKPHAEVAVLLTQAELQIEQGQNTEALASLLRVQELQPGQPRAQELLAGLYERMEDWPALYALLEKIEKDDVIPTDRWLQLVRSAQMPLLRRRLRDGGASALREAWESLSKRLRRDDALLRGYAGLLKEIGSHREAIALVTDRLAGEWDPELALLYSELVADDPVSQLATVENWLKQYGEKPILLLVAGRLCLRNRLWGRARAYLESSLKELPRADTMLDLGRLYEEIKDPAAAQAAYRKGLEMAVK